MNTNGIFAKGYGILPKLVMLEGSISIDAKALYAYLCAYAGDGLSCYPPRGKILRDLGFSVGTYYGYLQELKAAGLVSVKKHRSGDQNWCSNRYILLQSPGIIVKANSKQGRHSIGDTLRDHGYGRIPLAAMTDRRISRKAKALYGYFCSFAGCHSACTPEIEFTLCFLNICVNSYYKYLNELLCYNYITVLHRKDSSGRYLSNSILLCACPNHAAGLLLVEERREQYRRRLSSSGSTTPARHRRRRGRMSFAAAPQQLAGQLRLQIDYDRLAQQHTPEKLNMIVGFLTELSFDPYSPVSAKAVTAEQVGAFITRMERRINPNTIIRNVVSYWQRSFINYLINCEAGLDEAR